MGDVSAAGLGGAIQTDDAFNEIERVNLRCRLAPHMLPSPQALIVTGVTPDQLVDPTLQDVFTFTHTVADLIHRWAPATWVGYNTSKFDEDNRPNQSSALIEHVTTSRH